jgi:translation initiation factor IF-2
MQQRQLRLGDILDDYCTRERRVTNHAIVAMVGNDVKQTRCMTCDTEHEYKHAKVPRQRRKADSPAALYAQVAANAPKRVNHSAPPPANEHDDDVPAGSGSEAVEDASIERGEHADDTEVKVTLTPEDDRVVEEVEADEDEDENRRDDEGPVHRPLIRASLPREGQPPPARPIPEFTIRQPGGRPNRFRPRHQRGGQPYQGDRSTGGFGGPRNTGPRPGGGRPQHGTMPSRLARRHGSGRKRQK